MHELYAIRTVVPSSWLLVESLWYLFNDFWITN